MNLEPSGTNAFVLALAKLTISEKCRDLAKLIDESSTKLLHHNYALIVQSIFGFNMPGWGIQSIHPRQRALECCILKEFLGCQGPMFRLVHKLQAESMLFRYEFPCNLLPFNFINVSAEQVISPQHAFRQTQNVTLNASPFSTGSAAAGLKGQTCIRVSAFEFYFYHFAHCIVTSPSPSLPPLNYYSYQQMPLSPDENLYYLLVDEYLAYFLPIDGSCPPAMPIPSSNTQSGVRTTPWIPHISSMLRKTSVTQATSLGITQNDIWRSDLLVHILVEFWLGKSASQHEQNMLPPSEDQMRAVRRLVKHMHYFNNVNKSSAMFLSHPNDSLLDLFKQNVMCGCLQPRLLEFLSFCFKMWPLNSTFRIVLETWLSYIQPWRYMDASNGGKNSEMRLSNDREIANMWYHFISSNLQFYNKLFCDSITRFLRMDISKQANSLLLYRVAKIFSQPNLIEMILEAETSLYGERSAMFSSPSPGSYISIRPSETAISSPCYLLGSEEVRRMINQMLIVCQQSLGTVVKYSQSQQTDFSSRVLTAIGLGSLVLMANDNGIDVSWKKSEQQIQDSILALSQIFDLSVPELDHSFHSPGQLENPLGPDAPDCSINEEGEVEITDIGRHEMMNNIKKLPVVPNTDPELRPITSFENAFLVRLLYRFSSAFNAKYENRFQQLCARPDIVGNFANYLLCPTAVASSSARRQPHPVAPRISLRYYAHYRRLFYISLYFVICKITDIGLMLGLLYLLLLLIVYSVLKFLVKKYLWD